MNRDDDSLAFALLVCRPLRFGDLEGFRLIAGSSNNNPAMVAQVTAIRLQFEDNTKLSAAQQALG